MIKKLFMIPSVGIVILCGFSANSSSLGLDASNDYYLGLDFGLGNTLTNIDTEKKKVDSMIGGFHAGGYLNENVGIETSFRTTDTMLILDDNTELSSTLDKLNGSVRLGYYFSPTIYPYLKVGGTLWRVKSSKSDTDGMSVSFGAGFNYKLNENINFRLDYEFTPRIGNGLFKHAEYHQTVVGVSWFPFRDDFKELDIIDKDDHKTIVLSSRPSIDDEEKELHFSFDSYHVSNTKQLVDLTEKLNKMDIYHLDIHGYTDNIGQEWYNEKLSLKRASAVKKILVEQGVDESIISIYGHGSLDPVTSNDTPEGREMNRRVEIDIFENDTKSHDEIYF